MREYTCKTMVTTFTYEAENLAEAMALHNSTRPDLANQVLSWVGPTGITFLIHDSSL